jgi:tol-pal system-associated acyl-CoA thioesterase
VSDAGGRAPFRFSHFTRVGFDETDAQGVVYYGRYLPYFDRARVEYLRNLGLLRTTPGAREFVMRANRVEYHAPARFDDQLEVFVRTERIGTSSVVFQFAVHNEDGDLLCTAEQVVVQIERETRRPVTVAEEYRQAVEAFEGRSAAPPPPADPAESAVADVARIVEQEGEADEILRQVVVTVARRLGTFCGIRFLEEGGIVDGPYAGELVASTTTIPVDYDGDTVAELVLGGAVHDGTLAAAERIAAVISPYCLVGWDTGGETWNP